MLCFAGGCRCAGVGGAAEVGMRPWVADAVSLSFSPITPRKFNTGPLLAAPPQADCGDLESSGATTGGFDCCFCAGAGCATATPLTAACVSASMMSLRFACGFDLPWLPLQPPGLGAAALPAADDPACCAGAGSGSWTVAWATCLFSCSCIARRDGAGEFARAPQAAPTAVFFESSVGRIALPPEGGAAVLGAAATAGVTASEVGRSTANVLAAAEAGNCSGTTAGDGFLVGELGGPTGLAAAQRSGCNS